MLEKVQKRQCKKCLFSPNKVVSDKRKEEILKSCKENNRNFICHVASHNGVESTCRGFYDNAANKEINAMLEMLGQIEFTEIN